MPRRVEGPGRVARIPQYTFRAIRLFSPLTCQVSRTIVDAAVRVAPDLEAGASALPQKIESNPEPQPEIELSAHMPKFLDTPADRRQTPRTKLVEIAYIGMGPENGGLVLDVSDGGLSFHAVAPVQPAQTIHFLLSLRGHSRIEGAGEVVWTNEMKTVCGLRFTSLSSGAREHLNNWTNQTQMPVSAREKALSPVPPAPRQIEEARPPLISESEGEAEPLFAIPPADEVFLSEPEAARMPWQGPLFYWIVFGLLGAALTVAAFIYGVHVGKSEISSVAQSAENPSPQIVPPLPAPVPVPASSVASDATSVPNVAPSVPSDALVIAPRTNDTAAPPSQRPGAAEHGVVASDQRAQQALEAGKSELAAALAYLNGDNGQRDSSKAVQLLWAAVANGNSRAEVILAGLYVNGDGVAKNCEQGRVLLIAATRSGNTEAKVKLNELNTNGCP
jgi:PilZ domain